MTKPFAASLATAIAKTTTTLVECLRITRRDGVVIALTTHDQDVTFDDGDGAGSITYAANPGFFRDAISYGRTLDPERCTVYGLLLGNMSRAAVRQRRFDGATFKLYLVDYSAPSANNSAVLLAGEVGSVEPQTVAFRAELLGLKNKLKRLVVESTSAPCRADLGDSRCGVSLTSFPGTLSSVTSARVLVASGFPGSSTPGFFDDGKLTFTSGALNGLSFEIKTFDQATKTFSLVLPAPVAPAPGDGFSAFQGCKKTALFCKTVFDNLVNFRGEPFAPEQAQTVTAPLLAPGAGYAGTGGDS